MEEIEHMVPPTQLLVERTDVDDHSASDCDEGIESATETSSVSSIDLSERKLTHKLSLINILEMATSRVLSPVDLEREQTVIMSAALSSISSQHDRSNRVHKLENAIKSRKDHQIEGLPAPQRAKFSTSPCHNASRFCRKPTERSMSEGGSPHHSVNGNHTIRIDSPCQVSVTSLNANIRLPMDRLSTKLFNPPDRSHTSMGISSPRRMQNGGSCFGGRGRTSRQYVIHPDWVSENLSIGKAQLTDRSGQDFIDFMKRSQSCPPPMRNVITWDNKYTSSSRHINGDGR